jgi:hypothetical protein
MRTSRTLTQSGSPGSRYYDQQHYVVPPALPISAAVHDQTDEIPMAVQIAVPHRT